MLPEADHATPLQAFAALERQHGLFDFRIDGWSAWRVMRNPVFRITEGLPLAQPARSNLRRSLQALAATAKLLGLLASGPRRQLLVKTCRSGLRLPQGDGFRDVYFDGLLQRGHAYLKLEEINSPDFDQQAAKAIAKPQLDTVVFTFWGRVLGRLMPVRALPFCQQVSGLLDQHLKLKIDPQWLLMRLSTVVWQARLFALLLKRVRPAAVLVADTGEYALSIVCRRLGIRFIELQHGVFDASHPDAVPAWVSGSDAALVLPHVLACRGEFWIDKLAGTRQAMGLAKPVGNELIDLARARMSPRDARSARHLVLTSQGLDSERLAQWVVQMVAAAPSGLQWRLSIKLHPTYDAHTRDFDSLCSDPRIRVIAGADLPNVFDLLIDADLHLSITSACHFDAAALGVPSIVVPLAGHEAMLNAVDGAQIFIAHTPAEVWRLATGPRADASQMHRFAAPGFVDNLQRLLPTENTRTQEQPHHDPHSSHRHG